jgi:hypothetical protein
VVVAPAPFRAVVVLAIVVVLTGATVVELVVTPAAFRLVVVLAFVVVLTGATVVELVVTKRFARVKYR